MRQVCSEEEKDLKEIQSLTPFQAEDLTGVGFGKGKMLGGAHPLQSSALPPWEKREDKREAE